MLPEDDPMIETCRSVLNELMNILDFLYIYRVIQNDCWGFNNVSVWNEFDYRVDVCRITKIAHIENL